MTDNQISITRALVELKTLDKRIQKQIDSGVFVSYKGQFHQPSPQVKDAVSKFQSTLDLLERRKKIKSAIVSSNANTKVRICGKDMTVAEAIETKSSIKHYKSLLAILKRQYSETSVTIENINHRVRSDLENKTTRESKKHNEEEKEMDLVEFSKKYMEMHGVEIFDPLKITSKIEDLEKYIVDFESEIDYILSEKNSTTLISV